MESLEKLLELLKESIESLRWWAFSAALASAYLMYAAPKYQPFVSQAYLKENDRLELIGLVFVLSVIVFMAGWLAAGVAAALEVFRRKRDSIAIRRNRIAKRKEERLKREAEIRLNRRRIRKEVEELSENQLAMLGLALRQPDGILKVSNDAALDLATLLVTRKIFTRIRPWYSERGNVVGEVFVVHDRIKRFASDFSIPNLPIGLRNDCGN